MRTLTRRSIGLAVVAAFGLLLSSGLAAPAEAAKKSKSVQTEAKWVEFDAASKTVKVRIRKPGRGNKDKELRSGKEALFNVKPEGSVLTRTTVAINGRKGELTDIPAGKTVNIYWVPDEEKEGERFARKIDVILSEEELEERYGSDDQ